MGRVIAWRCGLLCVPVLLLEWLCRLGVIAKITLPPPSEIVLNLAHLLASGRMNRAIAITLSHVTLAAAAALAFGIASGVLLHRTPRARNALEPFFATWYAIPVYAFYPLLLVLFGLGAAPKVLIGFMLAVVSVIVSMLTGLDNVRPVLIRTARVLRLSAVQTALRVTLPSAVPYLFTASKLAFAYAFIGVIGAEFILSRDGIGYEIRDAFENFDNATMYPLIVLVLLIAIAFNLGLDSWERRR